MIEYKTGDLLEADVEALVNTVNCVGVMGRGIALQFKRAWKENFRAYAAACKREEVKIGEMFVFETGRLVGPRFVINFPTKKHWRARSRMADITSGLEALVREIQQRGISSIAIPPLGAGLGGLPWPKVREQIEAALAGLPDVKVWVYEPDGTPEQGKGSKTSSKPDMTPGRAALVSLMDRYLAGLMAPFVSLLEVHKLMYFMQEAGQDLKLRWQKGHYGPYAENLRHVLNAMQGHYIHGYGSGGDEPDKCLEILPGSEKLALDELARDAKAHSRFDRVGKLVDGFESAFGLELLATVHWVLAHEKAESDEDMIQAVWNWNEGKKQFSRDQLLLAKRVLLEQDWLGNKHP